MKLLLPVRMTKEQHLAKAEELALALADQQRLRDQKKAFLESMRDQLAAVDEQVTSLAEEVRTREVVAPVECSQELDGDRVLTIRLDTGEVVSSREARPEDRQLDIGARLRGVE